MLAHTYHFTWPTYCCGMTAVKSTKSDCYNLMDLCHINKKNRGSVGPLSFQNVNTVPIQ